MARKKPIIQELAWQDYIQLLVAQRNILIKQYGQKKSGFAGLWGKKNDDRATATHIDKKPLAQVEARLKKYNGRNGLSRFFIRAFTHIKKQHALLHYRKTIDVLNILINQPTPLDETNVNRYLNELKQRPSASFSRNSDLATLIHRFKKKLACVRLLPHLAPTSPIDAAPSTPEKPTAPSSTSAKSPQPESTVVDPSILTTAPAPVISSTLVSQKEKDFLAAYEKDLAAFHTKIKDEHLSFQKEVAQLNTEFPHDEKKQKAKYQQAFVATTGRLKKAYFKLSLRYHPDKVSAPLKARAEECFKSILALHSKAIDELEQSLTYQRSDTDWDELMQKFRETREKAEKYFAKLDDLLQMIEEVKQAQARIIILAQKLDEMTLAIQKGSEELINGTRGSKSSQSTMHANMTSTLEHNLDDKKSCSEIKEQSHAVLLSVQETNQNLQQLGQQMSEFSALMKQMNSQRQPNIPSDAAPEQLTEQRPILMR